MHSRAAKGFACPRALLVPAPGVTGTRGLRRVRPQATAAPPAASESGVERIRIGTRDSKLARKQAEEVQLLLAKVRPEWAARDFFTAVPFETHGDAAPEGPLHDLGQGAFTEVIDRAIVEGKCDIAVHSLKDSPIALPAGVQLAACLPRSDPRDALISSKATTLAELPQGARVGTSSMRRKAQLLHAHPHLNVVPVRGSIDARLAMLESGELDAIVLAAAGLSRLGRAASAPHRVLGFDEMLPAACQGAIGVMCAANDPCLRLELGLICHEPTRMEVAAERAMLAALLGPKQQSSGSGSGSSEQDAAAVALPPHPATTAPSPQGISAVTGLPLLPAFAVACHAGFDPHEGSLKVEGLVASEDGRTLHRAAVSGGAASPAEAEEVGRRLGLQLRALAAQHGWVEA